MSNNYPKRARLHSHTVSTPSINAMIPKMVQTICNNDFLHPSSSRHCCSIFIEKNKSCFQTAINRYQLREKLYKKGQGKARQKVHTCRGRRLKQAIQ